MQAVAEPLFTDWVLAFEATALLLTIAAAGAVVLAQFRRKRS
jgi:NADH:ubiquinone oxidoreductase subunit 6 (subunit J)